MSEKSIESGKLPESITISLKIEKVTVRLTYGLDTVTIITKLPCQYPREVASLQESLRLQFDTPYDTGSAYCTRHFGIEPEVIDAR